MTQAKLISSVLGILYYLHQFFSPSVARHLKGPCLPLYTVCMTLSECARCVLLCMIVYNITQTVHGNFTGTLRYQYASMGVVLHLWVNSHT